MPRVKYLRDVLAVTGNEFRQLRRNRTAIIISLVVLPFFFTATLGGAAGGAGARFSPTAKIPIAFIDEDLSMSSGLLRETLFRSGGFDYLIDGYRIDNALATLGTGRIYAVILVPKGFEAQLTNGQTGTLIVYVDDGEAFLSDSVLSALRTGLEAFSPRVGVQPAQIEKSAQIQIVRKGASFSGFSVGLTIILGLVVIFATFYEIAGGFSRECEEGTYARLLLSPVSLGSILLAKTLYDLIINIIRTLIVLGLSFFVYGARPSTDFGTLLAISILIALVSMGFAFAISALGLGVRAVIIIEFLLVLFIFAFSGFIIDAELLQGISRTISSLLPWTYGIEMLRRTTLIGQPLWSLTYQLQFIGISIVALYSLSYVLLKISRERLAI